MPLSYVRGIKPGEAAHAILGKPYKESKFRVVPLEEVRENIYFCELADLAVIFHHDIVEHEDDKRWRWKLNSLTNWLHDHAGVYTPSALDNTKKGKHAYGRHCQEIRASLNMNTLSLDLYEGAFSMEDWMKFYMQIGYSLDGYYEVFGQREASEYDLPGALVPEGDADARVTYTETVIDYMLRVHKGEVLKL